MSNIGREPSQQMTMFLAMTAARQLSLLINLLGLMHQIAFLAIMSIARLASRTKLLDLVWEGAWIVFVLLMLLACASIAVTMVLTSLAGVSAPIDWLLQIGAWITKNLDSLTNIDGSVVFLTLIGTGLVVVAIIFSMLIIGIVRIGIFTVIGVMDQIRNQESFLNAILGTVAISVVPPGTIRDVGAAGTRAVQSRQNI